MHEGNRNQGTFILGCKAAKAGCDLEAVYANLAEIICSEDFTKEELKRMLGSAYQKIMSDKTREPVTCRASPKPSIRQTVTIYAVKMQTSARKTTWQARNCVGIRPNSPKKCTKIFPQCLPNVWRKICCLSIVLCCYEHCRLLFTSFNQSPSAILKDPNARKFPLEQLPPRFTRAEAVKVGESCGLSERTVERLLKKLEGLEIRKISHGCYEFANSKSI